MNFIFLVSNLMIEKAFWNRETPLLNREVVRLLILHHILSFDRFHTSNRMIYVTVVAVSYGQSKPSQNMTFFCMWHYMSWQELKQTCPGGSVPTTLWYQLLSCWVSGLKAVSIFTLQLHGRSSCKYLCRSRTWCRSSTISDRHIFCITEKVSGLPMQ